MFYRSEPADDLPDYEPVSKTSNQWQWSWWGVFLVLVTLLAAAGFAMGVASLVQNNSQLECSTQQVKPNVYVFGISFEDWGNWIKYYEGNGYTLNAQGIITPGSVVYPDSLYGETPPIESIDIINIEGQYKGRFSNGRNGIDFITNFFKLNRILSSEATHLPSDTGNIMNFAVGGATASGNVHNAPTVPLPHNYDQVIGPHGFNGQVADFEEKLAAKPVVIRSTDIFLYSSIGSNDISLIAACTNVTACIINFTDTHLDNIKRLYDSGMRRMILSYADAVFQYNPATIKYNTSGAYIPVFNGLSDLIFNTPSTGFLARLYAMLVDLSPDGMSELDLNVITLSSLISDVAVNPVNHGIRKTLPNDRDPRNYPLGTKNSSFPFPTLYDASVYQGANLLDTYYHDDNHPTEQGYQDYASYFIRTMSPNFVVCNVYV